MTELRGAPSATKEVSLRETPAAASVIAACLNAQAETPSRSAFARAFGVSPLSEASRRPYVKAIEELHVADELAKLGAEWSVLHSVPTGERGQVIDHLAIGPAGTFAIHVVHQPGASVAVRRDVLTVNGVMRWHLTRSRDLATEAAVDLTRSAGRNVPVHGLLVFVGAQSVTVHDEPDDVGVTSVRNLHRWLTARGELVGADEIAAITDAAADPSSWRGAAWRGPSAVDAGAFDALRVQVQRAWLARGFWGTTLLTAAAITAVQLFG